MENSLNLKFIFISLICLTRSYLVATFNFNSKECELASEINTKTIECFFQYPQYKNECSLGKRLLLDHYNIIFCNVKRIHKRYTQTLFTPDLIFQLGHFAYTNPCSIINYGQTKCASRSIGLIKCVSKNEKTCIHL
jgi:hypothetical protein